MDGRRFELLSAPIISVSISPNFGYDLFDRMPKLFNVSDQFCQHLNIF